MSGEAPLHCPACGGPHPAGEASVPGAHGACRYCGGPLVALGTPDPRTSAPCVRCHTAVAASANFCQACGHRAPPRASASAAAEVDCPGCGGRMERHTIAGGHPVDACRACGGAWAPRSTLDAVVEAARTRPRPEHRPPRKRVGGAGLGPVVYRRCPTCETLMARRNFARISGVILDQCPEHGTYFDAGELPAVVEFVRAGGLELAQRRENDELRREQARLTASKSTGGAGVMGSYGETPHARHATPLGIDLVASFVGWVVWWGR